MTTTVYTAEQLLEHILRLGCEAQPLKPADCDICAELNRRAVGMYGQAAHWDSEALDV